ncbi:unnamed protein product [Adineta steineri]|uniref:Uncharacterized protein n=1 Tax=Adineta steineri TaxID=433720 RepID=A0A813RFI9_9BILA|nr:unnamed protein product [Adineta steineri]
MISTPLAPKNTESLIFSLCCVAFAGAAISGIVILSLISVYLANKGSSLNGPIICSLSFTAMTSQRVGNGPSYISGADLNNDHKIDLVTANYDDSTISVLLGNGDNTFQNQVKYSTGTTNDNPNALYIADVNKDGNLDVVTANSGTSNVAVFLGKGDGTFSTAKTYSTGTGSKPIGLVLGDLNKDGNNDLVVTDETNNVVLIFLGDGTGAIYSRYMLIFSLCCVAFAGAAISGIVILSLISVYLANKGSSLNGPIICGLSFTSMASQRVGNGPSYISGADLNNDHKIDLVTANYDDSTISVLLGNGDNTFQNQVKYSTGTTNDNPNALYIADVNKDGNLDVVTANSGTSNVAVFLGKGDGTFSTANTYSTGSGSKPIGLVLGDLNKDGNNDLVVTDETNNVVLIFLGDGTGAFTLTNTLSSDKALEIAKLHKIECKVQKKRLEDINEIFDDMINYRISGRIVLDFSAK